MQPSNYKPRKNYAPAGVFILALAYLFVPDHYSPFVLAAMLLFIAGICIADWLRKKKQEREQGVVSRPLFQIHLSTAFVMMIVGSLLAPWNIAGWQTKNLTMTILTTINILLIVAMVCEAFVRRLKSK